MKIFNKEENSDSKEDIQTGAENPGSKNSGSSAEKVNEARESSEKASVSQEAEKSTETICQEENQILKDQLFRLAADFDNFRKRTARQMEENRKVVLEQVLLDFVEVTDNFDRALKSAKTAEDMSSIVSGIEQLSRQFFQSSKSTGLRRSRAKKPVNLTLTGTRQFNISRPLKSRIILY